jgi:glycosyltransferase involved in cell wall biosynthesis
MNSYNINFNCAFVIPCYNEEKRLPYHPFLEFATHNKNVLLCFVNDGSKDNTLDVINQLANTAAENVIVYDMPKNGGKAEAVRNGILHVHQNYSVKQIGFLDADLATCPNEFLQMAKYKENLSQFGAIVGSRIVRLGANIQRDDNRSFFSKIVKRAIRFILKTPFQDTQCGAKMFDRNLVPFLFDKPFLSPWLFDVEIFLRLQQKFGKTTLQNGVLEYPLMNWTEVGDSKLTLKHTLKIPLQLSHLFYHYKLA